MSNGLPVLNSEGNVSLEIPRPSFMDLIPDQFVIKRVYTLMSSGWHQPQGRDPMAGKRTAARSWGVDFGLSRVPRLSTGRARFAPGTVKGRLAHPPRSEKRIIKKVNKKEKILAIQYAIAATANRELVLKRGHRLPEKISLPIVFDQSVDSIEKSDLLRGFLIKIGLSEELERLKRGQKFRSGASRLRGRSRKRRVGPLIVTSSPSLTRAARNLPGIDISRPEVLSLRELAPNGTIGRLTLWSCDSIPVIERRLSKFGGSRAAIS